LGCDGQVHGINYYDNCCVCGGDGTECYHPCNTTLCSQCVAIDGCSWCIVEQSCIWFARGESCKYSNETQTGVNACPANPVALAVGLSAGIIAAIVVSVVVAVGVSAGLSGKFISDYYKKKQDMQGTVENNPTYNQKLGRRGSNILYVPNQGK